MEFDLESDLWNQAEFTRAYVEPPPSLAKRRGRASIYDDDPEELVGRNPYEGHEPQVKMIRGRPVKVKNDEGPGGLQAYHKTQKDIREVCGVGFSNELIEKYIQCNQRENGETSKKEENTERVEMPDLSFKKFPHKTKDYGNIPAMYSNYPLEKMNFELNNESDFPSLK